MSSRWPRRFIASGAALLSAKALHIAATDDWEDIVSYPERTWNKFVARKAGLNTHIPHVIVLGTGWGALSFLRHIDSDELKVTVVSPRPYFFYTPLLAGTATGTVGHHSIIEPIRWFCTDSKSPGGVTYVQADCTDIDVNGKAITCCDHSRGTSFTLPYDHLVVAVGAEPATFNIPGVKENAHFMKEIADSIDVQDKILRNLEQANTILQSEKNGQLDSVASAEVDRLLHWIVVGGGPTGVELVAEITDFIQKDVSKYFPHLSSRCRVTLLEATGKLLSTFDGSTSSYARNILETRGALVLTDTMVTKITTSSVFIKSNPSVSAAPTKDVTALPSCLLGSRCDISNKLDYTDKAQGAVVDEIRSGLVVWAGGITMRPFMREFIQTQLPKDVQSVRWGVVVDGYCRIRGAEDKGLWALGDCAVVEGCAPTAQAASQQGSYLGRLFRDNLKYFDRELYNSRSPTTLDQAAELIPPSVDHFKYVDQGALAYVGGNQGVAELKNLIWVGYPYFRARSAGGNGTDCAKDHSRGLTVQGRSAFAIWRSFYFSKLMSLRNVCQVCFDWGKAVVFGREIATVYRANGKYGAEINTTASSATNNKK